MTSPPQPPGSATTAELSALVREHQTAIWRYLRGLGCQPAEADDLTQETFLNTLGHAVGRFAPAQARAYLKATAGNAWRRRLERERRLCEIDLETADAIWTDHAPDDDLEAPRRALRACLASLQPRARRAIELRFVERRDRAAIATALAMKPVSVKSLLARTYATLRQCISRRLADAR